MGDIERMPDVDIRAMFEKVCKNKGVPFTEELWTNFKAAQTLRITKYWYKHIAIFFNQLNEKPPEK